MAAKEQAVLEVSVTGVDKAASQFSSFQQTTTRTMSASEAAVSRSLKNMVSQFVGVAAAARAVQTVISSGIGFNQFMENTTMSFTVMMKSAEKAKAQMKDLYNFAVNSPLTFKETASSSKQLMAYGFTAAELIPTMKTLGSVAIATGHSLDDISYVYGTLKSQGRAYSRDLMQFGMRGIPIYEELAKVMGVNINQIQKMASEGKIGFAEVEKAFQNMTTGSGRFSGVIEGYMTTLTGKLSMLSDVAQQSAGTLFQYISLGLKDLVDSITRKLQSAGMQSFIEDTGRELGSVFDALKGIVPLLIDILPLLKTALTVYLSTKVIGGIVSGLKKIPELLLSMGQGLAALSAISGGGGIVAGFSNLAASASLFTGALAAAIPVLSLLAMGVAAIGTPLYLATQYAKDLQRDKGMRADSESFRKETIKAFSDKSRADFKTLDAESQLAIVKDWAEYYGYTVESVAEILSSERLITAEMAKQMGFDTASLAAKTAVEAMRAGQAWADAAVLASRKWGDLYAVLGGDISQTKQVSEPSVKQYIATLESTMPQITMVDAMKRAGVNAEVIESATKKVYGERSEKIQKALEGVITLYPKTEDKAKLKEELARLLNEAQKQLEGFGRKAKKPSGIDTWWAPLIKAASLTLDPLDDINIATAQAQENATKEYEQRKEAYTLELAQLTTQEDRVILIQKRNELEATYLQYQKDITAEGEKQKNLSKYNSAVSGNAAYWSNMQAQAGSMYGSGNYAGGALNQGASQLLQGTEVGNVQSGGMGIAGVVGQATTAFTSMIGSIENVGKVLNPFATLMESVKAVIEPILNNALKPLVQILTQVGKVVGKLLTPFIGILKVLTVLLYVALTPLVAILQIVGNAFSWLYDSVIVPFANGVIAVANAFIGVINFLLGWLGVNVEYIDALQTSTDALQDFSDLIDNMKNSLDQTIDYLTKKINDSVDKQLASLQDLYQVGAITASSYESQASALNAQKINTDYVLVSNSDKALTNLADIYDRLAELYDLKNIIENTPGLTEAQQKTLLENAGLNSMSIEKATYNAVLAALREYKAATTGTPTTGSNTPLDPSNFDYGVAERAKKALVSLNELLPKDILNITLHGTSGTSFEAKMRELAEATSSTSTLTEAQKSAILTKYGFATGTGNVPQDMIAQIHQGEGIVPATFMDSIRSGELTLSGGRNEGSGQTTNVYVTVQGSVQAENDLASTIATAITRQKSRGMITVSA